eukprot:16431474-Heterocapsa_arctica.AAC.1
MADDIENSVGFDPDAPRKDDELLENETFRNCIAARGMLAAEATKQLKLAQSAALRGRTYEPPVAVIPNKAKGINPLAALAREMAVNPKAVPSAAPTVSTSPPAWISALVRAKGREEKERSRRTPVPKPRATPAKASPPTAGRPAIAKAKPLMAKSKEESKARSSASRPPIPKPEGAPPGNFDVDPWLGNHQNPIYIGLPGGPAVTVQQLRALRFSQDDYARLSGGPGSERGFLWSDAINLANRCQDFQA